MELRIVKDKRDWSPVSVNPEVHFTLSFDYGDWQVLSGREVFRLNILEGDIPVAMVQLVKYPLAKKLFYFYAPYGPVFNKGINLESLSKMIALISDFGREKGAVFVRLDPYPVNFNLNLKGVFRAPRFSFLGSFFQPRSEWFLDLTQELDVIKKKMHEKTRYCIGLSERKGLVSKIVRENFVDYFDDFIRLMKETGERGGFSLHEIDYYGNIFLEAEKNQNAFLSVVYFKEEILSIDFIFMFGQIAHYVFGGSSNLMRNLNASHLSKWSGVVEAKRIGLKYYNFGGIVDQKRSLNKDWKGITEFKTRFGGFSIEHSDLYDIVLRPFWYYLYILRKFIKSFHEKIS